MAPDLSGFSTFLLSRARCVLLSREPGRERGRERARVSDCKNKTINNQSRDLQIIIIVLASPGQPGQPGVVHFTLEPRLGQTRRG